MNIVIFSSDSHDGRILQSLGYPAASTPNMDRLAAGGTTFENAYCSSPQCVPSRASMWSGRHVHAIPAWNNYTRLSDTDPTFLSYLADAGFNCKTFGKTDYLGGNHAEQNRLSAWIRSRELGLVEKKGPRFFLDEDEAPRSQQMMRHWGKVDQACDWLREHSEEEPFCCYVGVNPPHPGGGYRTNRHWWNHIQPEEMEHPPHQPDDHPAMRYMRLTKGAEQHFSARHIADMRRAYLARIAEVDAMLGQVLDTLDELDHSKNTVIIYLSDHGDLHLEHGQYLKNALYEGSMRVPLIISHPQGPRRQCMTTPVSLIDFLPTILDLAGVPAPEHAPGRSLVSAIMGEPLEPRPIFGEYHSNFQQVSSFMLRSGSWKLMHFTGQAPLLFHIIDDPDELTNCATTHPDIVKKLSEQLAEFGNTDDISQQAIEDDRTHLKAWITADRDQPWQEAFRHHFPDCQDQHLTDLANWALKTD